MGRAGWPDSASNLKLLEIISAAALAAGTDTDAQFSLLLAQACRDSHCPCQTATVAGQGYVSLTVAQHQARVSAAHLAAAAEDWALCRFELSHAAGGWPQHDGDDNATEANLSRIIDLARKALPNSDAAITLARATECQSHCPCAIGGNAITVADHRQAVSDALGYAETGDFSDAADELDHAGGGEG